MNLSRAAKKFRDQMPKPLEAAKPARAKKEKKPKVADGPEPAPQAVEPVAVAEPTPAPVVEAPAPVAEAAPAQSAQPKKAWPEKVKRPRFVFVREKTEKREQTPAPALPPRSTKFSAKLLTKHLAPPPADDTPKSGR